jgi:hypothetical protein
VTGQFAKGIVAKQPGLDFDAGEMESLRCETGHFLVGQASADRQGLEALGFLLQLLEAPSVSGVDFHHLGQRIDGLVQISDPRRRDFQRVGGVVGRQHDAVSVQDQAAVWARSGQWQCGCFRLVRPGLHAGNT